MTLPFWRSRNQPAEHFVEFHHYEQRISALEAKQKRVNAAILAYVEADISATWMSTAKELAETLREALKE